MDVRSAGQVEDPHMFHDRRRSGVVRARGYDLHTVSALRRSPRARLLQRPQKDTRCWITADIRSADALGACHLFRCGITGIPPRRDIHRTALGTENAVPWSYHAHSFDTPATLPEATVIALEQTPRSVALGQRARTVALGSLPKGTPRILAVGHGEAGVSPEVLERADACVAIPCRGAKRSLNVAVACGIALYTLAAGPVCSK